MLENPYRGHELYKIAEVYRQKFGQLKQKTTPEDYLFENQLIILRTQPPMVVQPYQWKGEPYKSGLRVRTGDGKRLILEELSIIEQVVIKRLLDEETQKAILKYIYPKG